METLEARTLLSATFEGGILTLNGTAADNMMEVVGVGASSVTVSGVQGVADGTRFNSVTEVRVNAGTGNDSIRALNVAVPVTLNGGSGNDSIEVQASGAGVRNINVIGAAGDDNVTVIGRSSPTASSFRLNLNLNGGTDNDNISVDVESSAINSTVAGSILTAADNDEVKIDVDHLSRSVNATTSLTVDLNAGNDKLEYVVDGQNSGSFTSRLITRDVDGTAEINSKVNVAAAVDTATVEHHAVGSSANDKYNAELISEASLALNVRTIMSLGGGDDLATLKVDHQGTGGVTSLFRVDLGAGNDEFIVNYSGPDMANRVSGFIRGQSGTDQVNLDLEGDVSTANFVIDGGIGNDELRLNAKNVLRSTANRSLRLLGGDGNDQIILIATIISGVGADLIDGGTGFDVVDGFGEIINAEVIT